MRTFIALLAAVSSAPADDLEDARTRVAQLVALAELAPAACPTFKTNPAALASFLAHAGMTATDVTTRYTDATRAVADDFAASTTRDAEAACAQTWAQLGDKGLGLLISASD